MSCLIIKLGATGDVLRTTTLLHIINDDVTWITSEKNEFILKGNNKIKNVITWERRNELLNCQFNLIINLEDEFNVAEFIKDLQYNEIFGAYLSDEGKVVYTDNASLWFDMSIISKYGIKKADHIKLNNRKSYQEILFSCFGKEFKGEKYILPNTENDLLKGDIAIAPKSGVVWPMKNWPFYEELSDQLRSNGYIVNMLPMRDSIEQHICDIKNHKMIISGDSLPMHIAMGLNKPCITIFICTSPWEIYDYGLQKQIISPNIEQIFYKREYQYEAVTKIDIGTVYRETINMLEKFNI